MAKAKAKAGVMYLVQRQGFTEDGWYCNESQAGGNNGARVPLKLFPTRAAAEAYRDELAAKARRAVNPFRFSGLGDVFGYNDLMGGFDADDLPEEARGHLPAVSFEERVKQWRAGLKALGLTPPDPDDWDDREGMAAWWDRTAPALSDERIATVWGLFEGFHLFEVVEIKTS